MEDKAAGKVGCSAWRSLEAAASAKTEAHTQREAGTLMVPLSVPPPATLACWQSHYLRAVLTRMGACLDLEVWALVAVGGGIPACASEV